MYQILAYFIFNVLGFFVFYFIWLKLDKPEPYDYTTISGLKCQELELKKAAIVLPRGVPINKISKSRGNLDEIQKFGNVNAFLTWLHDVYGPLAAFHWGCRYVVSINSLILVEKLKRYEKSMRPLNALLYASILVGDPNAWKLVRSNNVDDQEDLFLTFNPDVDYVPKQIEYSSKWKKGPLCVVFDCEIEIDAHPVPADIPVLISVPFPLNDLKWILDKSE